MALRQAQEQNSFVAFVTDQLRRWSPVAARRRFGGHGVYRADTMFAIVSRDTLYFRTDAINQPDFEAAGMAPFRVGKVGGERIALSYHEVPAEVLEDAEILAPWADRAFAAALRRDDAQRRGKSAGRKRPQAQRRAPRPPKRRKG